MEGDRNCLACQEKHLLSGTWNILHGLCVDYISGSLDEKWLL